MSEQALEVTTELVGTVHVVRVAGRMDTNTADGFDVRMHELVNPDAARLVLDLAQVNYMSSAGLRSLLVLIKQVKTLDGALVLAAVHPRVQDILNIAGFTAMFTIVPTTAEALARLQQDQ